MMKISSMSLTDWGEILPLMCISQYGRVKGCGMVAGHAVHDAVRPYMY